MTSTINGSYKRSSMYFYHPVKITTNNVTWFKENKTRWYDVDNIFFWCKNCLLYSGANNSIYLIRDKKLHEIKADRMPIGIHMTAEESFTNNDIELKKDDHIYMFSDGYMDQFGGPRRRKFLAKRFKQLLIDIHDLPLAKQKQFLKQTLIDWQGEIRQVDDILVIGIKV